MNHRSRNAQQFDRSRNSRRCDGLSQVLDDGATLRIEHPITDPDTWLEAFARCADALQGGGVRAHRVHRPVGDPFFVMIDLDFDTVDAAAAFREFLTTVVWATP